METYLKHLQQNANAYYERAQTYAALSESANDPAVQDRARAQALTMRKLGDMLTGVINTLTAI